MLHTGRRCLSSARSSRDTATRPLPIVGHFHWPCGQYKPSGDSAVKAAPTAPGTLTLMPKIVDHAARRREIAEACLRVVSRSGLTAATTREIAKEAGVSHGIIAHYFSGKDAILRAALQRSYEVLAERIDLRLAGLTGSSALRRAVFDALPTGEESRTGEQIELAFWAYAMGDAELTEERWQSYAQSRERLEPLVRDARRDNPEGIGAPAEVTDALIALLDGLGVQVALYPERFPPERLHAVADAALTAFGFPSDAPRGGANRP